MNLTIAPSDFSNPPRHNPALPNPSSSNFVFIVDLRAMVQCCVWSYRRLLAMQKVHSIITLKKFSNRNSNMGEGEKEHTFCWLSQREWGGWKISWGSGKTLPAQRRISFVINPRTPARACPAVLLTRMPVAFLSWVHNLPTGKSLTISRCLVVISIFRFYDLYFLSDNRCYAQPVYLVSLKTPKLKNKYLALYIWCQNWDLILNLELKTVLISFTSKLIDCLLGREIFKKWKIEHLGSRNHEKSAPAISLD